MVGTPRWFQVPVRRSQIGLTPGRRDTRTPADEPVLEVNDIQGNSLAGFSKSHQLLLFLEIIDARPTRAAIQHLAPNVATTAEVVAFNRLFKQIRARKGTERNTVSSTWRCVGFTYQGLAKLTAEADLFHDAAFREGLHSRSALLGDPTDDADPGCARNWVIGSPGAVPDVLLVVASDLPGQLAEVVAAIKANLGPGLRVLYEQPGQAPPAPFESHEHFGFRDGISQPGVRGLVSATPGDYLTARENPSNPHEGRPGQLLVWPGEFVFGYPGQHPSDPLAAGAVVEGGPVWSRNGSFLVFRRYRQNVSRFREGARAVADQLGRAHPQFAGITPEAVMARFFGRWRSGAPLMTTPTVDNPALAGDECANNRFGYTHPTPPMAPTPDSCPAHSSSPVPGDPLGRLCPHAAHIRRAYPRDDVLGPGGTAEVQRHRLIRRGIPFGAPPPAEGERGLLFVAYQSSIERQFEYIQRNWLNNPDFNHPGSGIDPIAGRGSGDGRRPFTLRATAPGGRGTVAVTVELPDDWVTPTGGGYFFVPSLNALRRLAQGV